MAKYRIKEHDFGNRKYYEVQKKSVLGYWFNPFEIVDCEVGWFNTIKEAKEAINQKETPVKSKVVWVS